MLSHVPGLGMFWLHERTDDANSSSDVILKGIYVVWLSVVHDDEGVLYWYHLLYIE